MSCNGVSFVIVTRAGCGCALQACVVAYLCVGGTNHCARCHAEAQDDAMAPMGGEAYDDVYMPPADEEAPAEEEDPYAVEEDPYGAEEEEPEDVFAPEDPPVEPVEEPEVVVDEAMAPEEAEEDAETTPEADPDALLALGWIATQGIDYVPEASTELDGEVRTCCMHLHASACSSSSHVSQPAGGGLRTCCCWVGC